MFPGSIEVVVVAATGADTAVVIVVEGEVISHTVLAEGGAVEDFKLQPIKVLPCATRRNAPPLLALYICHPCTCHRIRLYITERLISQSKAPDRQRLSTETPPSPELEGTDALMTTAFVLAVLRCVAQ